MSKSRGIPFSAPMVRALLAGNKTQTRRVIKPDGRYRLDLVCPSDGGPARCPQGAPGDRLWVREAWRADVAHDALPPREIPPGSPVFMEASALNWQGGPHDGTPGKLRPGMFMPRWASRISLQITEVRVERLQDISETDARAEGCEALRWPHKADKDRDLIDWPLGEVANPHRNGYALLWEQINGAGSWDANPWVWAVGFNRIESSA